MSTVSLSSCSFSAIRSGSLCDRALPLFRFSPTVWCCRIAAIGKVSSFASSVMRSHTTVLLLCRTRLTYFFLVPACFLLGNSSLSIIPRSWRVKPSAPISHCSAFSGDTRRTPCNALVHAPAANFSRLRLQRCCEKVATNNWLGPWSFKRSSKTEPDQQKN